MKKNRFALSAFVCMVFCCLFSTQGLVQASSYSSVLASMQVRQGDLEKAQLAAGSCLGERLDGFLEINYNCPADVSKSAEAENSDRKSLFDMMAASLGTDSVSIGVEWAGKRSPRYVKGMVREIRLEDGSTTFWNGIGEHPDKNNIPQVLSIQYAKIYSEPSSSAQIVRDNLPLYEAFGVVKKEKDGRGNVWYLLTEEYVPKQKPANWNPKVLGWMSDKDAIPWRRALVMRFNNSIGRKPSILFKTAEDVLAITGEKQAQRKKELDALYDSFDSGKVNKSSGAIALEPAVGKEQQQVVMYPVLDFYKSDSGEVYIDGMFTRILEVAAQTRGGASKEGLKGNVPMDIVFVMDLTNSMKPYLEKLLVTINSFAKELGNQDIRFGFVGYQDKNKKFSFTVKQFTKKVLPPVEFTKILGRVEARNTPVKTDDIPEAVMPGVNLALDSKQWRKNSAKLILLIGDAPGREDVFTIKELQDKSFTRQIPLMSAYIDKSKGSKKYNKRGKKQYRELSVTWEGAYGTSKKTEHIEIIDGGSVDKFGDLVHSAFKEVKVALEDLLVGVNTDDISSDESLSSLIFQQAELLLADPTMPDNAVVGWVADKAMDNPGREALAPMILLNEAELDELEQRVGELKDIGEKALRGDDGTTLDFFDLVSTNTRFTIINPSAVNFRDAFSAPLGIGSLPYDSDIMATTREEFHSMDRVQRFVRSMKNKLRHYEYLERQQGNPNVWKKLSSGTSERDRVVGVELNQLP